MLSFENDYNVGAHPAVLKRLIDTNLERNTGYGADSYSIKAKERIRQACGLPDAGVEFLVGGTQTNAVVISTMLKDYEGVIAADTGHVSVHEAGAIEHLGFKVLTVPHTDGKISRESLAKYIEGFYADQNHEHMVFPGMVYISHPTEYGTLYSKSELTAISALCRKYGIPLYMDGARLAYGLMSRETDLSLRDIASLCDVFYIGGTKCGTLFGEAVVYTRGGRPAHFITSQKKRGALLAKGWLLGVQFDALFTDGLYYEIGRHAIEKAETLKEIFDEKGYEFYLRSPTNQQYITVEDSLMEKLSRSVAFSFWEKSDETHTVIRFVTNWATTDEDLDELRKLL